MNREWFILIRRVMLALLLLTDLIMILPAMLAGVALPEGDMIAFMYESDDEPLSSPIANWDLYLLDVRTGAAAALTNTPYRERFPKWSPDGSTIAYHANPEMSYDVFMMDSHGQNIQSFPNLSRTPTSNEAMIDWSPDGSAIIFHSGFGEGEDYHLYISEPRRGLFQRLLPEMGDSIFGAWSPDGSQIAFSSTIPGSSGIPTMALYVMDTGRLAPVQLISDTPQVRQLTDASFDSSSPDWSPDGTQLVFMVDRGGANDIYIINADGSNSQNITRSLYADNAYPEWIADGRIIFTSDRQGGDFDLYIMDADGSNVRRLSNLRGSEIAPSWKP